MASHEGRGGLMSTMLANIFGASPVQPLEKHIGLAYDCAKKLRVLFAAAVDGDWGAVEFAHNDIERLEQEADDLKKEIRLHLPKSLFMPVPRQDLLELLMVQDRIANLSRDISGLVIIRRLEIPEQISGEFLEFVDRVIDAAKQARTSVNELDELYTTGFRGAEAKLVESMIEELDRIETDTDERQVSLSKKLFEIEDSLNPVNAMFLYRTIEMTGDIADMAERVGRRLEMLLSR